MSVSVGVNYDLVRGLYAALLPKDDSSNKQEIRPIPEEAYVAYLHNILRKICEGSARLFYPFAVDFLRSLFVQEPGPSDLQPRAPVAINLFVPQKDKHPEPMPLKTILDRWRGEADQTRSLLDVRIDPALGEKPELVFAIASAFALRSNRWQDADRFSDIAARKAIVFFDTPMDQEQTEYLYVRLLRSSFEWAPWHRNCQVPLATVG